jgi:large subunit ribosomal protein L30
MMAKIKITQTGSPIRRDKTQRATLVGLGLNKLHRTVEVEETPEVAGQVRKVQHLLKVEEADYPISLSRLRGRVGEGERSRGLAAAPVTYDTPSP